MAKGRGNPVEAAHGRKVLSQSVVHPVADEANTSGGNPAKLRGRKQNASKTLNQKVLNPSDGAAKASKPKNMAGKHD